jgi:hypothetical protein
MDVLGMCAEILPDSRTIILHIAAPFEALSWAVKGLNQARDPGSGIARK